MLKRLLSNLFSFPQFSPSVSTDEHDVYTPKEKLISKGRTNSDLDLAIGIIQDCWIYNNEVTAGKHGVRLEENFIRGKAERLLNSCKDILSSDNPLMANREHLANATIRTANAQVLVISPPPFEDATGLRGHCGITGELKSKLMDLVKVDKDLREKFHQLPPPLDYETISNELLYEYRFAYADMNVFTRFRAAFGDYNIDYERDWFRPFFISMCASAECTYRDKLGMQSSLEDDPKSKLTLKGLMYSTFLNMVMNGERYPDLAWGDAYSEKDVENPMLIGRA